MSAVQGHGWQQVDRHQGEVGPPAPGKGPHHRRGHGRQRLGPGISRVQLRGRCQQPGYAEASKTDQQICERSGQGNLPVGRPVGSVPVKNRLPPPAWSRIAIGVRPQCLATRAWPSSWASIDSISMGTIRLPVAGSFGLRPIQTGPHRMSATTGTAKSIHIGGKPRSLNSAPLPRHWIMPQQPKRAWPNSRAGVRGGVTRGSPRCGEALPPARRVGRRRSAWR